MTTQELLRQAERFFDKTGGTKEDRCAVTDYMRTGEGREAVEAARTVTLKRHEAGALLKPFLTEIAAMQTETDAFRCAYRFFDYATLKVEFNVADDFVAAMTEFIKGKLTVREAMLLDIVNKDYTKHTGDAVESSAFQCYHTDRLYKDNPKFFSRLRDEAFALTEADFMLSERARSYYSMFLYAFLEITLQWDDEYDTKKLFEKCAFWERMAGRGAVKEAGQLYRYGIHEGFRHHIEALYRTAGRKEQPFKEIVRAEGDSIVPYRYHLVSFIRDGYEYGHYGELGYVYDVLLESEERGRKFLGKEYAGVVDADILAAFAESYFKRHPKDTVAALNGLFFCGSKKVTALCSQIVERFYDDIKENFARYIADNPSLSKENASAVKALRTKLAESVDVPAFVSVDELEACAASCPMTSASLIKKFDFSQPVYDQTKSRAVSVQVLKVILDKLFSMKEMYRNKKCDRMVELLDGESFGRFIDGVFAVWEESDYDNKLKAAAVPYCFYTSNNNLFKLKKQCAALCESGRHTLASYIISVMAMSGGKYALMVVDSIANKFPYPKARSVAREALAAAADKYKIPPAVLGDMIIPDYGFAADGTRTLSCGDETLRLVVLPDGEVELYRGDKRLKSFPSGADERVSAAKKEFSALKKDVKTLLKFQSARLESALLTGRSWTQRAFRTLFLDNPMMRGLCEQLIWGVYAPDGTLLRAFRCSPDGTATDAAYEEVSFRGDETIALVHSCDLTAADLAAWRAFTADNELKPPFVQLEDALYPAQSTVKDDGLDFSACKLKMTQASKLINKYGMIRLPIIDGGAFNGWYTARDIGEYGFEVTMDGLYVGCDRESGKDLALHFYIEDGAEVNDTHDSAYLSPPTVPTRLTSSVLSALRLAYPELPVSEEGTPVKMPFKPFMNAQIEFDEPQR